TLAALSAGKHVLVEKPAARCAREIAPVIEAAANARALVRVGFNHRYHPALRKAHCLFLDGAIGEPMYVRGRYGHGGRVGSRKEWRARPPGPGGGGGGGQGVPLIPPGPRVLRGLSPRAGVSPPPYLVHPLA